MIAVQARGLEGILIMMEAKAKVSLSISWKSSCGSSSRHRRRCPHFLRLGDFIIENLNRHKTIVEPLSQERMRRVR